MSNSILPSRRTFAVSLLATLASEAYAEDAGLFRFAISESLIARNVTAVEAKQAMTTWASEIKRQVPNLLSFQVTIPESTEIARKIKAGEIDAVVISAFEYSTLAGLLDSRILVDEDAPGGEEFILLVHRDSGIKALADLRGRRLGVFDHPKMGLGRVWLDSMLSNGKFGPAAAFFGSMGANPKLNLTVLSVFFKTTDVCLVSRRSFNTMKEMNPQLGAKLQELAASPKLVPRILVFRKDCRRENRAEFERAILALKTAPAGQQALALFEGTGVIPSDASVMKPSLELIANYDRLRPRGGK